jgi:histidinol-phosphate aminotransferase
MESGTLSFVRPAIRSLEAYAPGEQPVTGGFIKLNTNENPYPPSPRVIESIRRAATEDLRLYPDPMANRLRDKAAETYGLTRDRVLAGNGSDDLLAMIIRTCVGPGERVAYPHPTYSLYDTLVAIGGGEAVRLPFGTDFALPVGLASTGAKVTFVCNPNAPSGTSVPVERLAELARRLTGLLVVDEAYVDFGGASALGLVSELSNVVVLRTFSKSFSLAGMRIGLAFGPPGVIAEIAKVKDSYNLTRLGIVAGVAALEDYDWMLANVARIRQTRERLTAGLVELGFAVPPSAANFVLARRPGRDQRPLYQKLKERRILVRHFATPELYDALRITVGAGAEVDALLTALRQV